MAAKAFHSQRPLKSFRAISLAGRLNGSLAGMFRVRLPERGLPR
jgi:hypothetical protein